MNWFRIYHGLIVDARLSVAAKRASLRRTDILSLWLVVLDFASRAADRGSVEGIDEEEISIILELDGESVKAGLQALRDKGMILADGRLADWQREQRPSSAVRGREYRARRKAARVFDPDNEAEAEARRHRLSSQVMARHQRRRRGAEAEITAKKQSEKNFYAAGDFEK